MLSQLKEKLINHQLLNKIATTSNKHAAQKSDGNIANKSVKSLKNQNVGAKNIEQYLSKLRERQLYAMISAGRNTNEKSSSTTAQKTRP